MYRFSAWPVLFLVALLTVTDTLYNYDAASQELTGATLRDVFLANDSAQQDGAIGRLGVVLVQSDGYRQVGVRHQFRSGDRFRFDVTSNRNGWLYMLHAAPDGTVSQLWPRAGTSAYAVRAGVSYMIPASPNAFVFSEDSGQESFYVAIRSDSMPPDLARMENQADSSFDPFTSDTAGAPNRIVNFDVRDPFGTGLSRAVVFETDASDSDSYLYFSAVPEDDTTSATVMFQLQHIE